MILQNFVLLIFGLVPLSIIAFVSQNHHITNIALRLKEKSESWISTASFHEDSLTPYAHLIVEGDRLIFSNGVDYDLASPRKWLEYMEASYNISGAYTVIRCDLEYPVGNKEKQTFFVWGENFHLDRIASSFKMMQLKEGRASPTRVCEEKATKQSSNVIKSLIELAIDSYTLGSNGEHDNTMNKKIKILMITLLWQPHSFGGITVHGHAYCSNIYVDPTEYNTKPINASISPPKGEHYLSRYDGIPQAKLSSWCRLRKKLEVEFKPDDDIGEVILSKISKEGRGEKNWELLEGLTSNLFIVYTDGSVRTAKSSLVLNGYARNLVLEATKLCGMELIQDSLSLRDCENGLWAEAFVTSSIKLIVPVNKLVVSERWSMCSFHEVWSETPLEQLFWGERYADVLYNIIIKNKN